jgi:hypothetical protein
VLQYHFNWKMLSAMAGVTWWNFYFRLQTCQSRIQAGAASDDLLHLPMKRGLFVTHSAQRSPWNSNTIYLFARLNQNPNHP